MIPKDKIEKVVIERLIEEIINENNLKELVELVNQDIKEELEQYSNRIKNVDTRLKEIDTRLGKLYDALETGKVALDDLAPRIRKLKSQRDALAVSKIQAEADSILQNSHLFNGKGSRRVYK